MNLCAHCHSLFAARRSDAVFCSGRCRVYAFRELRGQIPRALLDLPRWVLFDDRKIPRRVDGSTASSTDPGSWVSFVTAAEAARDCGRGVGFVLNGDGIACIDLDHCIVDGRLTDLARGVLAAASGAYVEISPSGTGLHVWGLASVGKGVRRDGVEVYDRGRYMTVTGRRWRGAGRGLVDIQPLVDSLI